MDSQSVKAILDKELAGRTGIPNVHRIDLDECLVPPTLQIFRGFPPDTPPWELWVVLEEDPVDHAGYKIAYDPDSGKFCLCTGKQPNAAYVGHYGTFERALTCM